MRLTWDAVLHVLRNEKKGMTNKEIAKHMQADLQLVTQLTLIMFKAGEIGRTPVRPGSQLGWRYFT